MALEVTADSAVHMGLQVGPEGHICAPVKDRSGFQAVRVQGSDRYVSLPQGPVVALGGRGVVLSYCCCIFLMTPTSFPLGPWTFFCPCLGNGAKDQETKRQKPRSLSTKLLRTRCDTEAVGSKKSGVPSLPARRHQRGSLG